ncbi:hypothetical protein [Comamonas suwonensis]|uniref:hypothetical protein n=1 Tax=Comamonas suwonensis TaxID=2606214 RepID=UPI00145E1C5B|nr:hypothetical protein [Comamonas suwonensis]MBI1623564.1 hypothetical protein [Comamonas suwonensis]
MNENVFNRNANLFAYSYGESPAFFQLWERRSCHRRKIFFNKQRDFTPPFSHHSQRSGQLIARPTVITSLPMTSARHRAIADTLMSDFLHCSAGASAHIGIGRHHGIPLASSLAFP